MFGKRLVVVAFDFEALEDASECRHIDQMISNGVGVAMPGKTRISVPLLRRTLRVFVCFRRTIRYQPDTRRQPQIRSSHYGYHHDILRLPQTFFFGGEIRRSRLGKLDLTQLISFCHVIQIYQFIRLGPITSGVMSVCQHKLNSSVYAL